MNRNELLYVSKRHTDRAAAPKMGETSGPAVIAKLPEARSGQLSYLRKRVNPDPCERQ
ncbi:hypothetical protein Acy02nite_46990 [Actinoplanes cyaneus]|uniref:Uncharacterized protein n=1 Tax=Actinoplanes cyaneus TaxID=52696 RepID=A0A919M715_9ACTN|nr:hypothetical protein [Actinoplanes cyaneus]GID66818.1 hypothetical protein Acy02nite_46990 [Actinoplanes cyaneus]